MTIYTPKNSTEKKEVKPLQKGCTQPDVDVALLENGRNVRVVLQRKQAQRCRGLVVLMGLLVSLLLLTIVALASLRLYSYHQQQMRVQWCGVTYIDEQEEYGEFQEQVSITSDFRRERIEVPSIGDFRGAVIMHEFERNYTVIMDRLDNECFIMPLNYSVVKPPRDFWDLISKLKSGYYLPDERMIRETYRINLPPVTDLAPYGAYIADTCFASTTYTLTPLTDSQGDGISKRDACITMDFKFSSGVVVEQVQLLRCD